MEAFASTLMSLIAEARQGKERALSDFVERYRPAIVAYIRRKEPRLKSEAEDLAQDVFITVFQDRLLEKFDPEKGRFRSLLMGVTRNAIRTYYRRRATQKRGSGRVHRLHTDMDVVYPQDDDFDGEWARHVIELAMRRLAKDHPHYHEALRMFVLEDKSYAEIMKATQISKAALKSHIYRGKIKLGHFAREEIANYSSSHAEYQEELKQFVRYFNF